MDNEALAFGTCPVARGLSRVGDAWSMLILRDASRGMRRFDQFQKSLGIAPNILTKRLAALVAAGVLERRRYQERPPRDEYVLTAAGRDYLPILYAMGAWGAKHVRGGAALSRLIAADDGHAVRPVVIDAVTGQRLADLDTYVALPAIASSAAHSASPTGETDSRD